MRLPKPAPVLASLAVILLTVTAACTRSQPAGAPERLPDRVAQTLTAAPTVPPSRTPPPSATPQLTATDRPTETPPPSSTPTEGPTPTATAPPLGPDDPRQGINLSAPDEHDDFTTRYGWFEYNDAQAATITWERGQLRATDNRNDGFLWWSTSGLTASDFYVETSATAEACQDTDAYGLAARIGGAGYDRGYTLEFSCNGQYRMRRFHRDASPETLVEWTSSDIIETGEGAQNRIGLLAKDSALTAFANGEVLQTIEDNYFVFGNFGLFAEANTSETATAVFRDFALWYLQP